MFGFGRKAAEARRVSAEAARIAREAEVRATVDRVVEDELTRETFRANRDKRLAACNSREAARYV